MRDGGGGRVRDGRVRDGGGGRVRDDSHWNVLVTSGNVVQWMSFLLPCAVHIQTIVLSTV